MRTYPTLSAKDDVSEVAEVLRQICRFRNSEDINDFHNLNKIFILGRQTARQPSSSADVVTGDIVGDFYPTATYLYILISNSGSPVWRRISMGSW